MKLLNWTAEDILQQEFVGKCAISPRKDWIAWEKGRPDKELDRYVYDLYLSSCQENKTLRLTRGDQDDSSPSWSSTGECLAFLSGRKAKRGKQIWLFRFPGGEPEEMTEVKEGIDGYAWRDTKTIVFSAQESEALWAKERKENKDRAKIVGDEEHYTPVRLFQLNCENKKVERLSQNQGRVTEFSISPDGRFLVTSENQSIHYYYDAKIPPRCFLMDLEKNERIKIKGKEHFVPYAFQWDFQGKGFYCLADRAKKSESYFIGIRELYYFSLADGKYTKLPLRWPAGVGEEKYHVSAKGVLVSLALGVHHRFAFYEKQEEKQEKKWKRFWLDDKSEDSLSLLSLGVDGHSLVFARSRADKVPAYYMGKIRGKKIVGAKSCFSVNSWMKKKKIARREIIKWKGARGDLVEGILYYPHDYSSEKKYPLVASIHGGPAAVDLDIFQEYWGRYPNVLASKGAFVLRVNYHGSRNYGLEWLESIKGHYYEYEVPDILTGIDYVVEKHPINMDQLGIMGWSNGSILAIQACIDSPRFKVLAAGAGNVNWTSDFGNCLFGSSFDRAYLGAPPWKTPEVYLKKSPLFQMEKMKTPTIIFFGDKDVHVPTEQGFQHYRALQQIGKAPVRFVLFPGEPHGLKRLSSRRRKVEEELEWFDQYLWGKKKSKNEALKKTSPLALSLAKQSFAQNNSFYGEKKGKVLLPEVIPFEDILVGRFPVTQAQFHCFDPEYPTCSGQENYPAHSISFDQAQAYCGWLSEWTKEEYTLPNEKEGEKLLEQANPKNENNLYYWAGYEPNPDEAELLQSEIDKLEKRKLLLMEVGSFLPAKETEIFDLAGNVVQWYQDGKKGKLLGFSAVCVPDTGQKQKPRKEYQGFRVVKRTEKNK